MDNLNTSSKMEFDNSTGKRPSFDNTDLQIISLLLKDSKTSFSVISEKLKVSIGTVHGRIKKLEEQNIINGFTVDVDFFKLGFSIIAFVGLIIDGKLQEKIVSDLRKHKEIIELYHTTGKYHLMAKVMCRTTRELKDVLINKINSVKGIEKTETTISLDEVFKNYEDLLS